MPRLQIRPDEPEDTVPGIPLVDTDREARAGRVAGALGLASIATTMASLVVQARDIPRREGSETNDRTTLLDIGGGGDGQVLSVYLRALSLVLVIALVWFLFRAVKGRNPATSPWIPRLGTVGFIAVAVVTVLGFYEVRDIGREFLASGPRTLDRAEELLDHARDDGSLGTINLTTFAASFMTGVWVSLASLESMRVGLLTRFLGVFGIGAGLATAISFPIGAYLFLGWLGSVALLAAGYWPGGRPPAWDEGRAVSLEEANRAEMAQRAARREERRAG